MNLEKTKEHRAWRPRIRGEHEFNPFTRSAEPESAIDHRTLDEIEMEARESEAREDEAEPIKVP